MPGLLKLVDLFGIPSDFVGERSHAVTHSFGIRKLGDESEIVWIRFLALLPSLPFHGKPRWRRSAVVLKWVPTPSSNNKSTSAPSRQVTLICFQPVEGILVAINRLFKSSRWEDALRDPYFLINASFETWHELVDENAWKLVDLSREAERSIFERSAQLEIDSAELLAIDYNSIHNLAKDAIHMVEGLDASLRSLECALRYHSEMEKLQRDDPAIWEATHRSLHYRREMFHSTRLRMLSVDQRLKNIINMAFNIGTMHDSRVMRQDSYVMKTLSILAMVFLPISTVSSIFGTQFFTTTTSPDPTSSTGAVNTSFVVNKKIWWLWTISIPVTVVMLVGWGVWIKRSQLKAERLTYWMKDVEKAKSA